MKKKLFFVMVISISVLLTGCSLSLSVTNSQDDIISDIEPSVEAVREICELCTLECKYHNVARSEKEAGTGFKNIGKKKRKFWIEYDGTAKISFDLSDIKMKASGNTIYIKLPDPKIEYDIVQGSWNKDSYVISKDNRFFQKNKITADDQLKAIKDAQDEMKQTVEENDTLIHTARKQAEAVIESYIDSVGQTTGQDYTINWNYDEIGE